jgi:hypothetical protein
MAIVDTNFPAWVERMKQEIPTEYHPMLTHGDIARMAFSAGRAAERSAALRPPQGWRPISEAPKDGTTRLLFGDEDDESVFIGFRPIGCPDDAACNEFGIACYPTHFQPLPAAPTPGDAKEVSGAQ